MWNEIAPEKFIKADKMGPRHKSSNANKQDNIVPEKISQQSFESTEGNKDEDLNLDPPLIKEMHK